MICFLPEIALRSKALPCFVCSRWSCYTLPPLHRVISQRAEDVLYVWTACWQDKAVHLCQSLCLTALPESDQGQQTAVMCREGALARLTAASQAAANSKVAPSALQHPAMGAATGSPAAQARHLATPAFRQDQISLSHLARTLVYGNSKGNIGESVSFTGP